MCGQLHTLHYYTKGVNQILIVMQNLVDESTQFIKPMSMGTQYINNYILLGSRGNWVATSVTLLSARVNQAIKQ